MIHYWGNAVEGILWIATAVVLYAWTFGTREKAKKRIGRVAAVGFFWFGVSDFIEMQTGAWYRPAWLLLMKGACVAVLAHCLLRYVRLGCEKRDDIE